VTWTKTAGGGHSGPFVADTEYTATVSLTARAGYTFKGIADGTGSFTHSNGTPNFAINGSDSTKGMVTIAFAAIPLTKVTGTDLTLPIPAPVPGAPGIVTVNATEYTGTVTWTKTAGGGHSGPFAAGTEYTATVSLTARTGYTFKGIANGTGSFTHSNGTPNFAINGSDPAKGTVRIEFTATAKHAISGILNLTPYFPAPAVGATPVTVLTIPPGSTFTGGINWNPSHPSFKEGQAYTAMVTLNPETGYAFAPDITFAYAGGTVGSKSDAGGGKAAVPIAFSAITLQPVTDTNLSPHIPAPVSGAAGTRSLSTSQYSGTVAWTKTGGAAHSGPFEEYTAYTATVTLTPASDYTLTGLASNAFRHTEASSVSYSSGKVTINFPAPPPVILSFGSADTTANSARKLMAAKKGDAAITAANPLVIDLPAGAETIPPCIFYKGTTSPAAVVINGGGRTLELGSTGSIIIVENGVTLTLRDITLRGHTTNTVPLVRVSQGGTLILESGVVIRDNTNLSSDGGGAFVGGTLTLNGGTITNNTAGYGGGVAVSGSAAHFTVAGGAITDNIAKNRGGGVYVDYSGKFTVNSGTISENQAAGEGGGMYVTNAGAVSLSNVVIRNNAARSGGGVAGSNTHITMTNSSIRANTAQFGGAVYISSTSNSNFTMTGGKIAYNTTTNSANGGVYLLGNVTITMSGDILIQEENPVYIGSNTAWIIIGGTLTQTPWAAYIRGNFTGGQLLLKDNSTGSLVSGNYTKFMVNGALNKIDASGAYIP
jgi:hypothetical protein